MAKQSIEATVGHMPYLQREDGKVFTWTPALSVLPNFLPCATPQGGLSADDFKYERLAKTADTQYFKHPAIKSAWLEHLLAKGIAADENTPERELYRLLEEEHPIPVAATAADDAEILAAAQQNANAPDPNKPMNHLAAMTTKDELIAYAAMNYRVQLSDKLTRRQLEEKILELELTASDKDEE
jgi:hypothetical protein